MSFSYSKKLSGDIKLLIKTAGVVSPDDMNWGVFPVADIELEPEIIE
jgi:hypothetical protein